MANKNLRFRPVAISDSSKENLGLNNNNNNNFFLKNPHVRVLSSTKSVGIRFILQIEFIFFV